MGKSIKLLVLLYCLLSSAYVRAYIVIDGLEYSFSPTTKEASVVRGCDGDITIPSEIEYEKYKYTVISIGSYAFSDCSGLTSVTIPNSVTEIGNSAFSGCTGLKEVHISSLESWCKINFSNYNNYSNPLSYAHNLYLNGELVKDLVIPETVSEIKSSAFSGCTGLTSITIPNSVTEIGERAFSECSGLTSVAIPNSVTEIGSKAFYGCTGLKELILEDGEEKLLLETSLFSFCPLETLYLGRDVYCYWDSQPFEGLKMTSLTISNSVTSIGYKAFSGCSKLTSITIPNSVTEIGNSAFSSCSNLTSVTIPNSVTSIGEFAFSECYRLTSITIPNSVTSIGNSAFYNCIGLTSITFGNSVTSIGSSVFYGCYRLTSVTIPNSVTEIGNSAFYGCSGLKELTLEDGTETLSLNCGYYSLETLYLGRNLSHNSYYAPFEDLKTLKSVIITNSVTEISGNAFSGCSGLSSVTIGNSVTKIGDNAFRGCSGLTSIIIPNSVTQIGYSAFYNCSDLTEFTLEDGTETLSLGNNMFSNCPLETLYLGRNLSYDMAPFQSKKTLKSVTIGNSVTKIGSNAFSGCSRLTSITIPNSVTYIGGSAFERCSGLTSITIPNSVTSIGQAAFWGCSHLTSVTIPNSVTEIGNYAFWGCSHLTSVTIPNSVTTIGNFAFYGCYGLTEITIGNSVTKIGSSAFNSCKDLTSVTCLAQLPPSVDVTSFDESVYGKATLRVPDESVEDYKANEVWSKFFNLLGVSEIRPIGIEMELADVELTEGESTTLNAIITPENATDKSVTWSSSDDIVASVDASGLVTAIKAGTATITATTSNGLTASCTVTVKAKSAGIEGDNGESANAITLSISEWTGNEGESFSITATISPNDATDKSVTWSSSDSSVASVDASGKVTAIKHGTAIITAATANGLTATCIVTVAGGSVDNPVEPEQPGDGDDDDETSAIDSIGSDANRAVRVEGNCIISPEGSEVFDLNGRRVAASGLRPGIYIVRIPGGKAVKIRVK